MNQLKVAMLFGMFMVLLAGVGALVGQFLFGGSWMFFMLIFIMLAAIINFVTYFWSDKIILSSYRAIPVTKIEAPRLYGIVERVVLKADMPMPQVVVIPKKTPNAFATGRDKNHAVVAATQGLLELLDDDELEGVIGHEMAHISNKDMMVMSAAATIGAAISFIAQIAIFSAIFGGGRDRDGGNIIGLILMAVLAPIAAMLIQMAISRNREYLADAGGAKITGKGWALAKALKKLEKGNHKHPLRNGKNAHSSLFIVNPFTKKGIAGLFSTHPPVDERIKRLKRL